MATCWCPPETKYGRQGPSTAVGQPPWGAPVRQGRPLIGCNPKVDPKGKPIGWGDIERDRLFGPQGWCNADKPQQL